MPPTVDDPSRQALLAQAARQVSLLWWVPLLTGLFSLALGLAILATDWTVKALVVITGLLFVIHGVALVFSPAYARDSRGEQILAGLAAVVAGIVLLAWPGPTLLVLAVFAGAWLAVSGAFNIVTSVARRHTLPYWGLTTAVGVIEVLLGVWAMRRPEVTLSLIVVVLGLWAVITGVIYCVLAFEVRRVVRMIAAASDTLDVGPVLDRVERLYAEGHLSTPEYTKLKAALEVVPPPTRPTQHPPAAQGI
jgi:uncharacterized membrane protein HdeD (DUF308 family)